MKAFEIYQEARKTGLTLTAMAVRDLVRESPGVMQKDIATKMGRSISFLNPIIKQLVMAEHIRCTEHKSPRVHNTYS